MFDSFIKRLTQANPPQLPAADAKLALCALLVRVAKADDHYAQSEIAQIDRILAARYGLTPEEVTALRGEAEQLEAEAPDTVRFTRAIKDAVPYEDRLGIVTALWQVALADGDRDHAEGSLLRLAANLLGVSDRESNMARKRIENANE